MINYRHQDLLNDDVLWVVRIVGGKMFRCGVVKFEIKLSVFNLFWYTLEYRQLTSDYVEEALTIMEKTFLREENVCRAYGIAKNLQNVAEQRKLMLDIVKDGVSIVVIDKSNNKVVGASLNKIHVRPAPGEKTYHGKFEDVSNESSNRLCAKFDDYTVSTFFELCQVDCLLELTMVGLLPEYRKDGNGRLIYQTVIDLGRGLATGVNTKQPVDGQELALEPGEVFRF
ncbi:hypothetical protein GEV33_015535 [Tenebrio molitor]|uniref:Uncharacterized protein n=1 Tax=Tenebrio molitor TaxID=7067 RepID=A0A8J6H3X9_TENMO|nr:hypothetical protein GEV33_015536 [Tenebrio molitor]KAH0807256.1 hypothetical protein GEV33_015535 [Tenebrio molitor]